MSNLTLLWDNKGDTSTITGNSWTTTLPLSNLKNKDLTKTARILGNTGAFIVDMGSNTAKSSMIVLAGINCSATAQIRIKVGNDFSFATHSYDSGMISMYGSMNLTGSSDWDAGSWWAGSATNLYINSYTRTWFLKYPMQNARYVQVYILDTGTQFLYLDIGRLLVGASYTFGINYGWGANVKWVDTSVKSRGIGARSFKDVRPKYRQSTFSLDWVTDEEAATQVFDMERYVGITGEVFICPDSEDESNLLRYSYLAEMDELSGVSLAVHGYQKTSFKFSEIF